MSSRLRSRPSRRRSAFACGARPCRGWSIIELGVVLAISAALLVFAIARYEPLAANVGLEADRVRNDLRLMQSAAVAWGVPLRFVPAAGGYSFQCPRAVSGTPCPSAGAAPDAQSALVAGLATVNFSDNQFEAGLSISPVPGTNLELDSLGRPSSSCATTCSLSTSAYTVTLAGGGNTATVSVEPISGFVH